MNIMRKEGERAPDISISDQNGDMVHLNELRGKKIVLYFYPKDNTPGCTAQACNLRDHYEELSQAGYVILGVSKDSQKSHQGFAQKQQLPFRLLVDTDLSLHKRYGTWVEKSMYGRKYMGTARVTFLIDEQGIIYKVISKVNTKDHVAQILE